MPRVCYIIVLRIISVLCTSEDRPTIKSTNGDLIIEPAENKNVYLRPNGPKSTVFIGNFDVLKTTVTDADDYQIQNFKSTDDTPERILKRIEDLENKPVFTNIRRSPLPTIINKLTNRVITLQNIINGARERCKSETCQHGGTCLDLVDGYYCLCPKNWEGKNCDEDVNECRNFAGTELGCQNGPCINLPGSYECVCRTGWYGNHCTRRAKDCSGGNEEMCGHGTCLPVTSGEGIICVCSQGWTSNTTGGVCLTDVNECDSLHPPRCSINPKVECVNLPGSFRCGNCPSGYEGDGFTCHDIDECLTIPNGGCSPMVTCHNTVGSRICGHCPTGYQGDGVTCVFRGSCSINNGGCHPSAACLESVSTTGQGTLCMCPERMDGDGIGLLGCYISSNDTRCEDNPCGSHGTCHPHQSGYTCACESGFGGAQCEVTIDVCETNPCYNGGVCRRDNATITGFHCECTAQFSGSLCEVRRTSCGGFLSDEEGSIVYPLSNNTYDHSAQCAWVIHTDRDKVINVTFGTFGIEVSPECSGDFLQIHDGRKSSSQLIGRFCGDTLAGRTIVSTHNNLYLWFRGDRSMFRPNFALHWTSVTPVCGGEIDVSTHGHISSPGSPGQYPRNRDCYWNLNTSVGKRISLHFFNLDIDGRDNCEYDYLAIYDGDSSSDPLLGKYCNTTQPAPLTSAGTSFFLHFHSDAHGSGTGFQISYASVDGVPNCGGYFTNDKGEIASPKRSDGYTPGLLCEYKIKTRGDTNIKINFKMFEIGYSTNCRFGYLKIYDGPTSDSGLVGTFCGNNYPKSYNSSSNALYLRYKMLYNGWVSGETFRLSYEAICARIYDDDTGVIKSPLYPFNYPMNTECTFIVRTDPGKVIQLAIQDFDVPSPVGQKCSKNYVEIRDGMDANSQQLGRYCGSGTIPPLQVSTQNYMYVTFKSGSRIVGSGFYANYTTVNTACGGIYREKDGVINFSATSTLPEVCTWFIIAPKGKRIELTWDHVHIGNVTAVDGDYLSVHEINDKNEEESIFNENDKIHPAITTMSDRVKICFYPAEHNLASSFSVSYKFIDETTPCGGHYVQNHGYILSPGWPYSYIGRNDCTWIISVAEDSVISLNITNFDLEKAYPAACKYNDYLEIWNGGSVSSPLIGVYCGSFKNKLITSLTNQLYLHFHSDAMFNGRGFRIVWDRLIRGCGGTISGASGVISSPGYPDKYYENTDCFYRIVTSEGSRIRFTVTELDLSRFDEYIDIYDGRDANARLFGKEHFKNNITNLQTTSNYAFIKYKSSVFGGKFLLDYNTVCNINLTGRYGVIESPDYDINYIELNCRWTITVPTGNKINITFTNFDLNDYYFITYSRYNVCGGTYVKIHDPSEPNPTTMLCNLSSSPPRTFTSKSNTLEIIYYVSQYHMGPTKFRLEWVNYGCGGTIQKDDGNAVIDERVTSQKEMECEWLIETVPGKIITMNLMNVYMSVTKNCSTDAIEIYNGRDLYAPILSKVCQPGYASLVSNGNFMLVRFTKKSSLKDVHFHSKFSFLPSTCGGYIDTTSGFIYSKNYPKNYTNNLNCYWYINVFPTHRIQINFIDLDLNSDGNCSDRIVIYENPLSPNLDESYRFCPNTNLTTVVTKSNNIGIQFVTDNEGTGRGFKAYFSIACGAVITANKEGVISNTKIINLTNENTDCVWTIKAPTLEQKISLTLIAMSLSKDSDVVTNRNCPSQYLRVFDGDNDDDSSPLIGEYCGRKVPPMIVSRGSTMTVVLGSYTDNVMGTFSAHYTAVTNACGGKLGAEEGTIASPSYPAPYPVNIECEWTIESSPGNTAYVTFEKFDLQYSDRCNEDYLEIREDDGGGQLLGIYCGSNIPSNFTKATKIFIKFKSDRDTTGLGFVMHYGYLRDNVIEGDHGEITSLLYPANYVGAGDFTWHILTDTGDSITLSVEELEIPAFGESSYNKLTIYDGYDGTASILGQFNGVLRETKVMQSTDNMINIKLTLDSTNTGSIFRILWTKTSRGESDLSERVNCGSNQTEMILAGNLSVFTSPNYPDNYGNELNCEWMYKTQMGRHLRVTFTDFSLEETPDCIADAVSIYSAKDPENWKAVRENICKSLSVSLPFDASLYMMIKLRTDSSETKTGFRAEVSSKCGGYITDLSGDLSVLWEDVATGQTLLKCEWTVKVRPARTIEFKFTHFNISNGNNACLNFVEIRNGDSAEAPLIGKYCGYEHEVKENLETSSNYLYIKYTSNTHKYTTFQSFTVHYDEKSYECGFTSKLTEENSFEVIQSLNYPSVPVPYSECEWVFSAPPAERVRIDFIERFDVGHIDNCADEYVEIRDGGSSLSPLKARYCGREKPGTIKSTSNTMYVKYFTQLPVPNNGFKATLSIDVCGGTIFAESGEITTPGYPYTEGRIYGSVCEWRVIGPPHHVFLITPQNILLPTSYPPCATKLEIGELLSINNTVNTLKTICDYMDGNKDILSSIETSTNTFTVKLDLTGSETIVKIKESGFRITFNSSRPSCGGRITSSEGILQTPSYPQDITIRYCIWWIEVPDKTRRIRLELLDIDPERNKISIYNDNSRNLFMTIPSKDYLQNTTIIESVGNKLLLTVNLVPSATSHRFKAKFSSDEDALCGDELTGLNQEIVTPHIERAFVCNWHYNNQISALRLHNYTYSSIYIAGNIHSSQSRTFCQYTDSQIIVKSPTLDGDIFGQQSFCGNVDVSFRLPSNVLDIKAIKNKATSFVFYLNLKLQPCGGIVHVGENPVNILGNIPDSYNDTLDCAWTLVIPFNSRLEMKMEGSFVLGCDEEYIIISDTFDKDISPIGKYCNEKLPDNPFLLHYRHLHVQYHSNVKNKTIIKLTAKSTEQCGGTLSNYADKFSSPNYPKSYKANQECVWEILADVGFRISLQFIKRFSVEDTANCTKDAVIIYDYIDDRYVEMGRVCGRETPLPFNSTNDQMKVVFRTDEGTEHDGFMAQWTPICGGTYIATEKEQILYSPGYPFAYHPNMNCTYDITGENGQKIYLEFLEFSLEGTSPDCLFDNLTITGEGVFDYVHQIFCGSDVPKPIKGFKTLHLQFKTDGFFERKGFKIAYGAENCGGRIKNTAIITSSQLDGNYEHDMNCTWYIEAPVNKIVVAKFYYIDFERSPHCANDFLALYDGVIADPKKRIALLCGNINSTTVLRSTSNNMLINFVTDFTASYTGFKAAITFSYSENVGCGGWINLVAGFPTTLRSPFINNSLVYENYLDCHWLITSQSDTYIKITLKYFNVAPCAKVNQTAIGNSKCDCDFVEIRDGLNPNSLIIGTYCGHEIPPALASSENFLSVRFSTDGERVSSGFEATLTVHDSLCGRSVITVGTTPYSFKSPGYETGSIPRGINCAYHVNNKYPDRETRVTIKNLQLQSSVLEGNDANKCNRDRLIISSNQFRPNITTGKDYIVNENTGDFFAHTHFGNWLSNHQSADRFEFCGEQHATDLYLFGNIAINIITAPETVSKTYKGVEIELVDTGFCGRNYSEPYGKIQTSYETINKVANLDCYTLITAPENATVNIYFIRLFPEYFDDNSYLEIFDGNTTSARLLTKMNRLMDRYYSVFSTGRYILLRNHQNNYHRVIFELNYVTTDKGIGCGGKLNNIMGVVTSPLYPNTYKHEKTCEWELGTPVGTKLMVRFDVFDLGSDCEKNYLELVDSNGITVRSFCSESPADYTSEDNYLKLVFHTSLSNSGTGWTAAFIAVKP